MPRLFRRSYRDPKTGAMKKTAKFYGKYADGDGIVRRVPLSADKAEARTMLDELLAVANRERAGGRDPYKVHRDRPLLDHLADWQGVLTARGNTAGYVSLKLSRARRVIDAANFLFIRDLSASKVEAALAEMRKQPRFGVQTANHTLGAVKQFSRWLLRDRRTADDPLAHLSGGNVKLDVRHARRELQADELARLLAATQAGGTHSKIAGVDRWALYVTAVNTGLRASESASLTPESFAFGNRSTVTVSAAYAKNRREDTLPLHPDVAVLLHGWVVGKPARTRLWPGGWAENCHAGKMLRHDLEAARAAWLDESPDAADRQQRGGSDFLAYKDRDGRTADFHALRHTFISRLVAAGVQPKLAQKLARHSTIVLTMDRYTHTSLTDTAKAIESVPPVAATVYEVRQQQHRQAGDAARVTGPKLAPNADPRGVRLTATDDRPGGRPSDIQVAKPRCSQANDDGCESVTSGDDGIGGTDDGKAEAVFETDAFNHSATSPGW